MSLSGKRAELAIALSTVDDVHGYEYRPTTPRPGDAWPLWGGSERAEGEAFEITWRVLVFIPQDERAASDWIDAHVDDLFDALEPCGFVDSYDPVKLAASGGEQYALQFTLRSE